MSKSNPASTSSLRRGKQKLIIIDSNALIHRAFHALPPTLTDNQGRPTNAVYGFTMILLKTIKDIKPDYIAACFDRKEKTFRHEEFEAYKAQRVKAPDELYNQIPLVKEVLESFNIPVYEKAGFEADDLIGTIAHLKSVDRPDIETVIVTGDQDAYQLIDDNTKVLAPHKGLSETMLYDIEAIKEKFQGLEPNQLIDYKGIRGDVSDNIPGVKGIGEKGAIDLLNNFQTLENIYTNIDSPKIKDRTRELLKQYHDDAIISKRLATIILDVPIDFNLADSSFYGFDMQKVIAVFQKFNFKRLLSQLQTLNTDNKIKIAGGQGDLFSKVSSRGSDEATVGIPSKNTEHGIATSAYRPPRNDSQKGNEQYTLITAENLKSFLSDLNKQKEFCFDTETTGLDPFHDELVGISFCWQKNIAYYMPENIVSKAKKELAPIFTSEKIRKVGHNLKFDIEVLEQFGLEVNDIYFDTMVASYLLNPGNRQHGLDSLAFIELGYQMQPIEDLIGKPASAKAAADKGKGQICMADVGVEKVCWYSCEDADISWQLYEKFLPELQKENMIGLFDNLEMPLVKVLAQIETNGVKVDGEFLKTLSKEYGKKIKDLEKKIFKLAGMEFNVSSPMQLKEVLFEKLQISVKGISKTKTGISTAASELEKLQGTHPIIDLIMEYRETTKLKSTYLDAIPKLINIRDGRIHTSFNQTVTATGRLSSSNPNLQNIPIRTEESQLIRRAFVADKGFEIIKADYSQIELRIVASLSDDQEMLKVFNSGGDIHTTTAAFINEVAPEEVTKEMRRQAKEVNFGVLYGMGAWGLASRTGISNARAQEFITKYFIKYKGVKKYIAEILEMAEEKGYVETLYGRRRYIPEINSSVSQVRASAERMATNMPIQGTAADLIKLAMVEIQNKLPGISPKSKMILQVHDELVFEVPKSDVKTVSKFVKEAMCSVMKLRAPIEVEVSVGDNWGETEKIKL
ncbi:MAG: DNA polymerase I [Patescibacteria group bacterium]|jgi:DNA polymerase-1